MLQVEYLQVHNEENHSCEHAYKATKNMHLLQHSNQIRVSNLKWLLIKDAFAKSLIIIAIQKLVFMKNRHLSNQNER